MFMWTQILAGEDGSGADFDMVYFVGPTDVHEYFGISGTAILEQLDKYVDRRAKEDNDFATEIANVPEKRREFVRYYGVRASVTYSAGSHDEWNIFRLVNKNRDPGERIAIWFDGRSVGIGADETIVSPGYALPSD